MIAALPNLLEILRSRIKGTIELCVTWHYHYVDNIYYPLL